MGCPGPESGLHRAVAMGAVGQHFPVSSANEANVDSPFVCSLRGRVTETSRGGCEASIEVMPTGKSGGSWMCMVSDELFTGQ